MLVLVQVTVDIYIRRLLAIRAESGELELPKKKRAAWARGKLRRSPGWLHSMALAAFKTRQAVPQKALCGREMKVGRANVDKWVLNG